MPHEDLQVSIGGPSASYSEHVMHVCSKGHYCLTSGHGYSNLWIHHLSIDNFRFIRDSIDNYLAEYLPKEVRRVDCRDCTHLVDVRPPGTKDYIGRCEYKLLPDTCGKFEDCRTIEDEENHTVASKMGWCQSCEEKTMHLQDPRDGWWRCAVPGCEAESQELTPE